MFNSKLLQSLPEGTTNYNQKLSYPLVICNSLLLKMTIYIYLISLSKIVIFHIFHSYVSLPEGRVNHELGDGHQCTHRGQTHCKDFLIMVG